MIAAVGKKTRAIGKDNKLLWNLSGDLKRFKELTSGHPIIMGRKTFESIGRPLPNRLNIILTRDKVFAPTGCRVVYSPDEALAEAKLVEDTEIFIIGGGEVYKTFLPLTDRLYLTVVDSDQDGDTFFPDYSDFKKVISTEPHLDQIPAFTYIILEK